MKSSYQIEIEAPRAVVFAFLADGKKVPEEDFARMKALIGSTSAK